MSRGALNDKALWRAADHRWVLTGWLVAAVVLARCLPYGDDKLPETNVPGVNREAVLRLLVPAEVQRIGAVVPITVEATFAAGEVLSSDYCVRLAGEPGTLEFPFGDECGPVDAGPASMAATTALSTSFSRTRACLWPQPTIAGQHGASLIAAYLPKAEESAATLFGALYDNARCSGVPIVSTARVLELRGAASNGETEPVDAGVGDAGAQDAGIDASPPVQPEPSPDSGPAPESDGGATDAGDPT